LLARIQPVEHRLYPLAARLLAQGRLEVDGRFVHVLGDEDGDGAHRGGVG
jgi:folate-dependent phosphoribosylglycinamide formyltransferase PurN